jgi:hypothetical protein
MSNRHCELYRFFSIANQGGYDLHVDSISALIFEQENLAARRCEHGNPRAAPTYWWKAGERTRNAEFLTPIGCGTVRAGQLLSRPALIWYARNLRD